MTWIGELRDVPLLQVATRLGFKTAPPRGASGGVIYRCPACEQERQQPGQRDIRCGGSGVGVRREGRGWRCFACDTSGDQLDFVSFAIGGHRFRDLSKSLQAEARDWCLRNAVNCSEGDYQRSRTTPQQSARPDNSAATANASSQPQSSSSGHPEIRHLLKHAWLPVTECVQTSQYLRGRGIDPQRVADSKLACALKLAVTLPPCAHLGRRSWTATGHRLLVPLYNAVAQLRSVIARRIIDGDPRWKSVSPRGIARSGLIMACGLARQMLVHGTHPAQWHVPQNTVTPFDAREAWWPKDRPFEVIVAEGEPDFLTWATEFSDAAEYAPAVLGIVEGSWCQEIADRIPDNTRVVIATHHDAPDDNGRLGKGDIYARRIAESLRGRRIEVVRWQPPSASEKAA